MFVLNTETTKIKTEIYPSIVNNFQTIIIGDLDLEKEIVINIDTIAIISEITLPHHVLHILDNSILEILSIDLDLKILDQEIEISIIDSTIKITRIVIISTTQTQIITIKKGTEAILYPFEIEDLFHKTIIERDPKTDPTRINF